MGAHIYDSALGRQRQISTNSKSARGMLQNPILKNQTNININKNQKIRGESKQASGATCGLGLALHLESQRGQGDMLVKGCLGEAPLQSLRPTSWGMLQRDDGKELCSTCILFIDPCHSQSCDRNNQKSAAASLSSFSEQIWQEEAGRLGFNTVDPEVGTAGVVLVSSIGQFETVCFRVECLPEIDMGQVSFSLHLRAC